MIKTPSFRWAPIVMQMSLAWRNVCRNWRHSLATILAIAFGFSAISLFDGFLSDVQSRNEEGYTRRGMLGHVIVQKQGAELNIDRDQWRYSLDSNEQKFLNDFVSRHQSVESVNRFLNVSGMLYSGTRSSVFVGFGHDLENGSKMRGPAWEWNAIAGVPLRFETQKGQAIIGTGLGETIGCTANSSVKFSPQTGNYDPVERPFQCEQKRITLSATTESAQINTIDLNVVGLFDAGFREYNKRAIHISLQDAQKLLDADKITMLTVQLKSPSYTSSFIRDLIAAAKNRNFIFDVKPWQEHQIASFVRNINSLLYVFRNLFMGIVVVIGVMSITNTMMKSVSERYREIGMLRSFGFRARELLAIFAFEGFFTSVIGCVLGLSLTIVTSIVVNALGIQYQAGILSSAVPLKVAPAPVAWAVAFIVLTTLALTTAALTARRACGGPIAQALRHN